MRWLASEALAALGEAALGPLLDALVHHGDSLLLRRGVHRSLREIADKTVHPEVREILKPVLAALESVEPSAVGPVAARNALTELQQHGLLDRIHWPEGKASEDSESEPPRSR